MTRPDADIVSRWTTDSSGRPAPNPVNDKDFADLTLRAELFIAAAANVLWDIVADPTQIGRLSPECLVGRWIEGHDIPTVGARFEGVNQMVMADGRLYEWTRPCTVVEAIRGHSYAYDTCDRWNVPATRWTFAFTPHPNGTVVVETMRHHPHGLTGLRLGVDQKPDELESAFSLRLPEIHAGMISTLTRLATIAATPG